MNGRWSLLLYLAMGAAVGVLVSRSNLSVVQTLLLSAALGLAVGLVVVVWRRRAER